LPDSKREQGLSAVGVLRERGEAGYVCFQGWSSLHAGGEVTIINVTGLFWRAHPWQGTPDGLEGVLSMARPFTLTDTLTWPPHERRVFVLEHLIRAQEDDLAKVEAQCRADPNSTLHAGRAADLRVVVRVLNEILDERRTAAT